MKWNIICALVAAATVAALPQTSKPADSVPASKGKVGLKDAKTLEQVAPHIKSSVRIDVEPKIRLGAKREQVRFGPLEMPGAKPKQAGEGMSEHSHGSPTSGGIMGGSASGLGMLDTQALLRLNIPLALAKFLGSTMDPDGFNVMNTIGGELCKDCTVLAVKIDVIFENGTRADVSTGVYLHHILSVNIVPDRKMKTNMVSGFSSFCGGSAVEQAIGTLTDWMGVVTNSFQQAVFGFGAVDEFTQWFTTPDGKFNSGFYLGPKDQMLMQAEIVNYRKEPQKVFLQFEIEYLPGQVGSQAVTAFTTTTACDEPISWPGKYLKGTHVGKPMDVRQDGTLIAARGHMHDGGTGMTAFLNDRMICQSDAKYGATLNAAEDAADGKNWTTISQMTDCNFDIPVRKGDKLRIDAAYDKQSHPLRESSGEEQMQMGLIAFTFVPS